MEPMLIQVNPETVLADQNSRFKLKPYRVDRLAESILADGGVNTPCEATNLTAEEKAEYPGKQYRLTVGYYRHSAVSKLNKEQSAGLNLPIIIHDSTTPLNRLKRQLSENMERENQSPMDMAVAIEQMFEAGATRMDIRKAFARPNGRKGFTMQPASNAWINIIRSFQAFPAKIKDLIHEGKLGVKAAYGLSRKPKDKWSEILEQVEAARLAEIDQDDKEEQKYLDEERKASEAGEKETQAATEVETISSELVALEALVQEKVQAELEAHKAVKLAPKGLAPKQKELLTEKFKGAEAESKSAAKVLEQKQKDLAKAKEKKEAMTKKAQDISDKLAKARQAKRDEAAKKKKDAPVTDKDIDGAGGPQTVKLMAAELRKGIEELALPGHGDKVQALGVILRDWANGVTTTKQLHVSLAKFTGEYKEPQGKKKA